MGSRGCAFYSHSMQSNAFGLITVSPVRFSGSDSTDYLYSPCSTASVYHFFISVIKWLFCRGLRGLFPWNHYTLSLPAKQDTIRIIQQIIAHNSLLLSMPIGSIESYHSIQAEMPKWIMFAPEMMMEMPIRVPMVSMIVTGANMPMMPKAISRIPMGYPTLCCQSVATLAVSL